MSHQLLNELSIVAGEADLLRHEALNPAALAHVRVIEHLAHHMADECRTCELENFGETRKPPHRCGIANAND